jgi:hypothetical protein
MWNRNLALIAREPYPHFPPVAILGLLNNTSARATHPDLKFTPKHSSLFS